MPIRPKTEDWSEEDREEIAAQDPEDAEVEAEAPALDDDDDPDACAGEEIPDPLDGE